ncbi:MAG: hypothetical protein KBH80_00340 [Fervidobacterium sp.]|jgi:hypothetical protein|nr:hypothetical protein [Fervidobacterium sp.]
MNVEMDFDSSNFTGVNISHLNHDSILSGLTVNVPDHGFAYRVEHTEFDDVLVVEHGGIPIIKMFASLLNDQILDFLVKLVSNEDGEYEQSVDAEGDTAIEVDVYKKGKMEFSALIKYADESRTLVTHFFVPHIIYFLGSTLNDYEERRLLYLYSDESPESMKWLCTNQLYFDLTQRRNNLRYALVAYTGGSGVVFVPQGVNYHPNFYLYAGNLVQTNSSLTVYSGKHVYKVIDGKSEYEIRELLYEPLIHSSNGF